MSQSRPSEEDRGEGATPRAVIDSFSDLDSLDGAIGDFARELGRAPQGSHGLDPAGGPVDDAREPTRIGRYTVLRRIGRGGMGVVYAAYDDDLDRRVAIKLVRHALIGPESSARLRREAQALARLSHPNVIGVHEVGEHVVDDVVLVFVAMEFVRGQTLREWWKAPERSPRAVLEALLQAGRGLAAVHEAGMVHRDVKPENVMIGADGRVRLMDFGLARSEMHERLPSLDGTGAPPSNDVLTRSGALVGTPAYMAPEQFEGGGVGPRADQFAFCVMAWEALHGERPFAGSNVEQLVASVVAGRRREPPRSRGVARHIRRALDRGLAVDPNDRWPDMNALLAALARDPRKRWRALGVASVATAATALAIVRGPAGIDCRDRDARLPVWNDAARGDVRAALLATGLPYAEATALRVDGDLEAYAEAWMAVQVQACEGTGAHASDELRTAGALCLEHRRQALAAVVDVLSRADVTIAEKAVQAVAALPSVEPCTDVEYLAARVRPPDDPSVAARVEALREQLSRARVLDDAGAYAEGFALAESVLAEARELGYGPLFAEALVQVGRLADALSRWDLAESSLREAHAEAVAHGHDEAAADAAIRLVFVVGHQLARHDAGLEWGYFAAALVRRLGASAEREAGLAVNLGAVHQVRGEYDEALAHFRRGLEIREATLGPDDPAVARTLDSLGAVHRMRGEYDESIAQYGRALELRERTLGPAHPGIGSTLAGLAAAYFQRGNYDEAIASGERALRILEDALGPDHARIGSLVSNLGVFHERGGDLDRALVLQQRGLAIAEATVGREHPSTAISLENIANIHHARGREDEALPLYLRALAIREAALGPEHPHVAVSLTNIGHVHLALGDYGRAHEFFARALPIQEKALGRDSPDYADALENLGLVHSLQQRRAEARDHHRRALGIRERALGPDHRLVANSLMNLGNLAEDEGDLDAALADHERALAIVERALGPDHLRVALALYNIAQTRLLRREPALAVAALERAAAIQEHGDGPPTDTADTHFLLAKALVAARRDRSRAIELAERAREAYRAPAHTQTVFAEVEAFLRTMSSTGR